MTLRTLIADDEALARERLRFLLSCDNDIAIAGECRNGHETIAALRENHYDLLFLDIQMPGANAFDIIERVGAARMPIVVFVTAHNHYAVQAFDVNALDYLTKPVEPGRLNDALNRVKLRIASHAALLSHEQLRAELAALNGGEASGREYPQRLVVPNGTKDSFVNVDEIDWIEAADYYSCLHIGARSLMLRQTIKRLAETLDPKRFVRVHRSAIVNIGCVREILREGRKEGWVLLSNGSRLKMSKAGWHNLLAANRT